MAESSRRMGKFGSHFAAKAASEGEQSLLERIQVTDAVRTAYIQCLKDFENWRSLERLPAPMTPKAVLLQFLDRIDVLFLDGGDPNE
eukprot:2667877-Karenia_brevis.AAC.1